MLNLLFGWWDDIKNLHFVIYLENNWGDRELLKTIKIPIFRIQEGITISQIVNRHVCQTHFWDTKADITRFLVYISSIVEMQNSSLRHIPFITFNKSFSKEERDRMVTRLQEKIQPAAKFFC